MLAAKTAAQLTNQLEKRLRALTMANNRIVKKNAKTSDTEKICELVKFIQEDVCKLGSLAAEKESVENENRLLKSQLEFMKNEARKVQKVLVAIEQMRGYVEGMSSALENVEGAEVA